jgi:hypothetical protein
MSSRFRQTSHIVMLERDGRMCSAYTATRADVDNLQSDTLGISTRAAGLPIDITADSHPPFAFRYGKYCVPFFCRSRL